MDLSKLWQNFQDYLQIQTKKILVKHVVYRIVPCASPRQAKNLWPCPALPGLFNETTVKSGAKTSNTFVGINFRQHPALPCANSVWAIEPYYIRAWQINRYGAFNPFRLEFDAEKISSMLKWDPIKYFNAGYSASHAPKDIKTSSNVTRIQV